MPPPGCPSERQRRSSQLLQGGGGGAGGVAGWRCCCAGRPKGRLGRSCNRRRRCSRLKVLVHAEAVETFVGVRLELIDSELAVIEGVSATDRKDLE